MNEKQSIRFSQLVDLIENRLPENKIAVLLAQLPECDAETQANWTWLQQFAAHEASDPAGLSAIRAAMRVEFATRHATQSRPSRFKAVVARLTADSWGDVGMTGLVGARSADMVDEQRQLVFSTDPFDIALDIARAGTHVTLSGQILFNQTDVPTCDVLLMQDGDELFATSGDLLGEFDFAAVPDGVYQLVISTAELDVLTPEFHLTAI